MWWTRTEFLIFQGVTEVVTEAINPSLTDSPDDFLTFLLRTGCKHQAVERAPIRDLGGRAKNGNTSIIQQSSEPSPAFSRARDPAAALDLACSFSQTQIPLPPSQGPQQSSHHAEGEDPGAPRAASHTGDGGVGMAAQELCRDTKGPLFGAVARPWWPRAWIPPDGLPDLGCHSFTLEETFSCTRTSASFTSNKTSCRGE